MTANVDFRTLTPWRYLTGGLSVLLLLLALSQLAGKGLNWGMDFTGGVVTEVTMSASQDAPELAERLSEGLGQSVNLVQAGEPGRYLVRHGELPDTGPTVVQLLSQIDPNLQVLNSSVVGAQVGAEMADAGGLAIFIALICILIYLWYRFEWRLASGALLALLYDVLLVLGLFAATGLEFNLTVLAAVLAVVGYSLNDSIVIADRIRELLMAKPRWALNRVNDAAIAQTFARTLVTSGTTLTTVGALWYFGGNALEGFAIALFAGILSGTWSSIAIGTLVPELLKLTPAHCMSAPVSDTP
ncbi:protein translocase subunit SecF [Ferrimonas balearica]|uniref:protein translocase subunit SecF n=1 Tax=Ferrimonas balearica TaxID=44012 RepID=UPI001C9949AF|nr:protein translocase subunit SecF [Ferrimonas balearica]MBY5991814.1 protein translocase subunit SecF [Ferrimonas balearica]